MRNRKRRRISEQGMRMIESVLRNQDEEFAMEPRIKDQLHYNLGEEYFRKTRNNRRDDDDDDDNNFDGYYVNCPIE